MIQSGYIFAPQQQQPFKGTTAILCTVRVLIDYTSDLVARRFLRDMALIVICVADCHLSAIYHASVEI